jgi:hypothetical protein
LLGLSSWASLRERFWLSAFAEHALVVVSARRLIDVVGNFSDPHGQQHALANGPAQQVAGYKQSGFGREGTLATLDEYTLTKPVVINLDEGARNTAAI